jgi:hexulose-6-phosphate isomerase
MIQPTRRDFLCTSAAAAAALSLNAPVRSQPTAATFKKAMIVGKIEAEALGKLKNAGFDGVETSNIIAPDEAAKGKAIADKLGMRIHSVLRGWAEFNSKDPAKVSASLTLTESALNAAQAYGADAVLLVPCRIGGMPMPEAWDFQIEFDEKTGHVTKVAAGDNAPYQPYIDAHNHAIDTSTEAVKKLIPTAEQTKVIIALENVWNNLWVKPALFRHFVASFNSPWVKAYFDIGNHVKYAPPQDWIKELGALIVKAHIKDFQLNPDGHGGKFVHPRDGSIDWPAVTKALNQAGYKGWLTIEDGGLSLQEFSQRLDLIIAGK